MTIDFSAMLQRIVAVVFEKDFIVEDATSSDEPGRHRVRVSIRATPQRTVVISAGAELFEGSIPEHQVATAIFNDDVEQEKESELRQICLVMRAYLLGDARVEQRRRLFRGGTVPVVFIELDGLEWRLGRNHFTVPDY